MLNCASVKELSATDHQEIEWQFDAGQLESDEGWLGQYNSGSSGLLITPESAMEITDIYYDTDDWRFYRVAYALRVRNTDGEVVPDSKPFRTLTKGKKWKKFENVLKSGSRADMPGKGVR